MNKGGWTSSRLAWKNWRGCPRQQPATGFRAPLVSLLVLVAAERRTGEGGGTWGEGCWGARQKIENGKFQCEVQWLLIRCELQSREQDGVNGRDSCCRPTSSPSTATHQLGLGPRGRGAAQGDKCETRGLPQFTSSDTETLTATSCPLSLSVLSPPPLKTEVYTLCCCLTGRMELEATLKRGFRWNEFL